MSDLIELDGVPRRGKFAALAVKSGGGFVYNEYKVEEKALFQKCDNGIYERVSIHGDSGFSVYFKDCKLFAYELVLEWYEKPLPHVGLLGMYANCLERIYVAKRVYSAEGEKEPSHVECLCGTQIHVDYFKPLTNEEISAFMQPEHDELRNKGEIA